ncbi:MAG: T9SS type A sorting domain-containing protein [Candidatus Stahlbacteria bacterium]|nr:T9SS type A sorting domain-containing protein [Candidatus Stahlbacteria bacterium]
MKRYFNFLMSLFLLYGIAYSEWSPTTNLNTGRSGFGCVGLPNGKVIITGGYNDVNACRTYELFDPATGVWTKSSLLDSSDHSLAILLPNGKVICHGSISNNFYLYDPITQIWSSAGISLPVSYGVGYTLMKNGILLILYNGQDCQLYDYAANSLSATGSAGYDHGRGVEILLPNGNVLVTGGGGSVIKKCELYNPAAGSWTGTGEMNNERRYHLGVLLPPPLGLLNWGKVLMTAGASMSASELYDPSLGTWAETGTMSNTNRTIAAISLLPCGKVLIAGGSNYDNSGLKTCELYDPATGVWTLTDSMAIKRSHFSTAILYTGKILAMGAITMTLPYPPQCEIYDPSQGICSTKTTINIGRRAATITALPIIHTNNCSTNVLIAGGENASGAIRSCELYNYSTNVVAFTEPLNTPRSHHTATLLPSSEVLVTGGKNGGTALNSSETFNLTTQVWTNSGTMANARFDHTATLLKDGRVLVTGGQNAGGYINTCEIYSGGVWSTTGAMTTARARHSAILMLNGNILVIGGEIAGGTPTSSCEIWNGTNWTAVPAASMTTARNLHTATLLQSGKILVVGGKGTGGVALNTCEIYNPITNIWSSEGTLNSARYTHNTILLYSGLVLVTGGDNGLSYLPSCEIWDPAAGFDSLTNRHRWKVTASLTTSRAYHSSILIPSLKPYVYIIGGFDGTSYVNSIEEYDVGLGYQEIWQSTITNYPSITPISSTMNIEGTLFRGVSEADGGNYCHVASNDHPIISFVRVGGGNWQGNGGGEIMNMPNSTFWDTAHTNVSLEMSDFQGYYKLWSIVNGIPCKWYKDCEPSGIERNNSLSIIHNPQLKVYPNPARGNINLHLSGVAQIQLNIYDLSGRLVKSFPMSPITTLKWDGIDNTNQKVKSGIYFYVVKYKNSELKGNFLFMRK